MKSTREISIEINKLRDHLVYDYDESPAFSHAHERLIAVVLLDVASTLVEKAGNVMCPFDTDQPRG
jgi:hypothetical protein